MFIRQDPRIIAYYQPIRPTDKAIEGKGLFMTWAFNFGLLLLTLWSSLSFAESSLSWFEKIRYLEFGKLERREIQNGILDLSSMKDDSYWGVSGTVLFFPGELLSPESFQGEGQWDALIEEKKPILVEINNKHLQNSLNPSLANFGTFAIKFTSVKRQRLGIALGQFYHPIALYIVDPQQSIEIRRHGLVTPDPEKNRQLQLLRLPANTIDLTGDSYLIAHVSSPAFDETKSPNFSSFRIGPENYMDRELKTIAFFFSAIVGCFFLASIFYGFIFIFRRQDRSSLYLCLYAFISFFMASISFFELPVESTTFSKIFSLANIIGYVCIQFFTAEKIRPFLSLKMSNLLFITIFLACTASILAQVLSLNELKKIIYILTFIGTFYLIGLTIVLGLRHRINGTEYFIIGAVISCIFQYSVVRVILFGLNEGYGFSIILANLSMTIALALANAKDFAMTYQNSEGLRKDLQGLLKEVQEKEQARTLFFKNTSHELRTRLNGIIGFMQLIAQNRYGSIPQAADQQLQKCIRLAISLKNQVNTILDLAKAKKGNLALSNSAIPLVSLISEADDLAAGLLLKRPDLSFKSHALWNPNQSQFIGDKEKLSAILRNLLGNAFKFSDPLRPNAVELTLKREGTHLHIIVTDSGIGIPAEHQDKIFEEFQQIAGDARRAYEGTGLGLAMVRDFVKLMDGHIQVESEPGRGSRFTIDLPEQKQVHFQQPKEMAAVSLETIVTPPTLPGPSAEPVKVEAKGRLLVVDDNEMNCEVLKDLLEPEGFVVTTVLDGQEALRIMRREHPDLLLLDMMMPYFSGEDVIKAMQSDQLLKDIPVILITARASDDDRLFGLSLGADDYLAKPIHHEELLFRVKNILHRLDTKQKLVAAEEGQKLAHLGRLMQEYSHELKNVFQMDAFRLNETAQICEKILVRTPLQGPEWAQAAQLFSQEQYLPADQVRFSDLPYTENQQNQSKVLRSVRVNLSLIDMDGQTRLKIWHELLKLSPQEQEECEQTLYIVRNFLVMQHQTLYASELVRNILEYSWANSAEEDASTQVVMENVYRLIRPRLQRLGITMERPTLDHSIAMNQGQLMQVMLNLISNACDAVEPLDKDQKWIRISISEVQDRIVIRCANGGKPLTPEIAETMLQDSWSSKGKNGFGLGLGISLRLIQKAQGLLEINSEASHPEITLSLGSKASMGRRKTA